jgi:hypothetical protein
MPDGEIIMVIEFAAFILNMEKRQTTPSESSTARMKNAHAVSWRGSPPVSDNYRLPNTTAEDNARNRALS